MNAKFAAVIESLHPAFTRLLGMAPVSAENLPKRMPTSGVYLLSERGRHLYVGRSRRLRARIQGHSRPGATSSVATFAFRLAREATSKVRASYKPRGSRRDLAAQPRFKKAFDQAKARIRAMQVRFVSQPDPIRQATFEMYVAVAVGARYNDFDTH